MSNINLKLQGQFKYDIYNSKKELIESSDWIKNFITNSGVLYPQYFAFADCFRYLSLGSSNFINSTGASNPATTGLTSPDPIFVYMGSGNYTNAGFFGAGCGNRQNPDGVSLLRQWTLPDATGDAFSTSRTFLELMVSPGQPYVSDGKCTCQEGGNDCSAIAGYYDYLATGNYEGGRHRLRMCDATAAFSRIVTDGIGGNAPPISVASGDVLTISYRLDISVDTGINFQLLSQQNPLFTIDATKNWTKILLGGNITQPGLALINDGTVSTVLGPVQNRLQHYDYTSVFGPNYSFSSEYGESFIPGKGIPLEPSCIYGGQGNIALFLSEDNTQFLVNPSGGGLVNFFNYKPWNPSGLTLPYTYGIKPFVNDNQLIISNSSNYWSSHPNEWNIRSGAGTNAIGTAPFTGDVTQSIPIFSDSLPFVMGGASISKIGSRTGVVNSSYSLQRLLPTGHLLSGQNYFYIKSLVMAYLDASTPSAVAGDTSSLVPFYDCILSGISGSNISFPVLSTGSFGGGISGVISGVNDINNSNNPNYNFLSTISASAYPVFQTQLTWSAPCPAGVDGC